MSWAERLLPLAGSSGGKLPQKIRSIFLPTERFVLQTHGILVQSILAVVLVLSIPYGAPVALGQETNTNASEPDNAPNEAAVEVVNESQQTNSLNQDSVDTIDSNGADAKTTGEAQSTSNGNPEVKKHKVQAGILKVSFELEAVVDSPVYQVVNLRPKSFKELKLQEAAKHGQRVAKGQPLLQLDAETFERSMRSAEQAATSARLELEQAKRQAESLEESIRLELEAAELAEKVAREDLEYFLRQGRDQQVEQLNESLKSSEQYVEYAREEYEQLKKMYEADEITEETEEIVLRRAKNDLERSEYYLKNTRIRVERALNVDLDRQESNMKNVAARTTLDLQQRRLGKEQRLESVQLQVARAEVALESANRELALLGEDRPILAQFAQFAGIVFYGLAERGQWKGSGNVEELLVPGGNLPTVRPLMTVVGTEKLFVQAKCPERWLLSITPGMTAYLELTAAGGKRVEVECEELHQVPVEPGQYKANFRFVRPAEAVDFLPLTTGKIHGVIYEKENALLIPIEALQYDGATTFVNVLDESTGEQRRQNVTTGQRDSKQVEVVQGLREGEHVVLP